jgi:hypothetical protein
MFQAVPGPDPGANGRGLAESWRIRRVKAKKDLFIKAMALAQK